MNAKAAAKERLQEAEKRLVELSHRIHATPELGFEEERASTWIAEMLDANGFRVERGICGLPTAFAAHAGSGPLHIGICAEYDSLPSIGHACGHNIIGASAVGAAIAASRVADDIGVKITVLGTPAEEVGNASGKILMLERGAFAGLHGAMMVHPYPTDILELHIIAASMFDVHYTGKAAHASAFPELGINAADALTVAQTAIGLLRQHIRPSDRVHGITTYAGEAPNVIPANASARYMVRADDLQQLEEIRAKVLRCFEAGALAAGAALRVVGGDKPYAEMHFDADMGALYKSNAEALGRRFPAPGAPQSGSASTDMGNVSLAIPSIHPMIGIDSLPAVNHQPEFADHCAKPAADKAMIDASLAMAWTAIDMASVPAIRERLLSR
ncbi:MAG TPA: amidohydrolase [Terriglobales bacterium]|nr:amidohydrolase [Terriglobales bacterium]HXF13451.1 amidohydrolase [Terriglobales bacterium]